MVTRPQIEHARPENVREIAKAWKRKAAAIAATAESYEEAIRAPGGEPWSGTTAEAGKAMARKDRAAVNNLRASIDAMADRTIAAIDGPVIDKLRDVRALIELAKGEGFTVNDDLSLTFQDGRPPNIKKKERAEALAQDIGEAANAWWRTEQAVADQINSDKAALAANFAEPGAQQPTDTPRPPADATPEQLTSWWKSLSNGDQARVLMEHPEWINNLDGIPALIRDGANRPLLDKAIAEERARHPDGSSRLDDPLGVKAGLSNESKTENGYDPDRLLLMFNPTDGEINAAIAIGNPDEADHVSVTVPGMSTHGASLPGMAEEARNLRDEAQRQLRYANKESTETVAAVAWFGYDPPDIDGSIGEALLERRANEGAVPLASFYEGINATNENGQGVHLTALGHSYGSLTTAQALNELGTRGLVDDAVFYGSPGLGMVNDGGVLGPFRPITDESQLFLGDGHAFVMSAPDDFVSEELRVAGVPIPLSIADLGGHGFNPTSLPFEQLGTDAATTADGVVRDGARGHSEYPRLGGENVLRTPGYNMAIVVSGLAHEKPELLVR